MAITGTVIHDLTHLEEKLRLYPKELLAADLRAKNRTASATRTEAVRRLRADLPGLKAGVIRNQLKIRRATAADPRAMLDFTPKRFRLLSNFGARQTRHGVSVGRRLPWRLETLDGDLVPPQALAHAFLQRSRRGTANVWIRVGAKRYPITAIVGASLASAFRERHLGETLVTFGRARFRTVLGQEMRFRIASRYGLTLPPRSA